MMAAEPPGSSCSRRTFKTPGAAAQAYNDAVDLYWGGDGWKNRVVNVPVAVERRK